MPTYDASIAFDTTNIYDAEEEEEAPVTGTPGDPPVGLFTPAINAYRSPVEPTTKGPARGLFRHYLGPAFGLHNVYILKDGTVMDETPQSTYDPEGVLDEEALSRVARAFYSGHEAEYVNQVERDALENAGYTVADL